MLAKLKSFWAARSQKAAAATPSAQMEKLLIKVPIHEFKDYETYLRAGTTKLWASWKAVDLIAEAVMSTPFKVVRRGASDAVKVPGLDDLLVSPNERMTFAELVYLTVFHLRFTGNAYWYKAESVNGNRPLALIPINPKRVEIAVDTKTGEVVGYIVRGNGNAVTLDAEDVLHFKRPHPNNEFYGIGDLEPMQAELNQKIHADRWNEGFWKNGAAPSMVMVWKTPTITSEEEFAKLKAKWLKEYSGEKNAGKPAWLTGDWDVHKMGLSPDEMKAIESTRLTTETIFLCHGVPLSVAGIRDAANYATANIDDQRFRKYTVAPQVRVIADTMNTDLLAGYGDFAMDFELAGLVNMAAIVEALMPAFDRGWLSINEARGLIGLKQDEENPLWQQHFISAALVPLDLAGIADATGSTEQQARRIVDLFNRNGAGNLTGSGNGSPRIDLTDPASDE